MIRLLTLLIWMLPALREAPPETDYRRIFGSDYDWAVRWLRDNDALINRQAARFHIDAKELKAIVFPELVRYNKVFDAIEIGSLKYLYVSEGKSYADFSVGFFQMKPSFAERVERDAGGWLPVARGGDTEAERRDRVRRLTDTGQQVLYLCAFYKVCEKRFRSLKLDRIGRLKFFATCYNAGYHRSTALLMSLQNKKHFYGCNYSEICMYYFLHEN